VIQDVPFIAMLNRYGIKATFNLNSQLMQNGFAWRHDCGMDITRLRPAEIGDLYEGHEIASHTLTHPYMDGLSNEELFRQLGEDKGNLEAMFGRAVAGFAVPFDYYDDRIARCAEKCGFEYARTSDVSLSYTPCRDWYHWKTGIYHVMPELVPYVEGFLKTNEELALCQIVGHSYDLFTENLWDTMESICAKIGEHGEIWKCTHLELVCYLKAMEQAEVSDEAVYNGSDRCLWFCIQGQIVAIQPREQKMIK
jgi:hypothetical protein